MDLPALNDTIVAVSTAWAPAPVGIIRLSGSASWQAVAALDLSAPADTARCPHHAPATLTLDPATRLPATVFWFRAPRSYTGQHAVELHTVGNLPLLRRLAATLIDHGARRALPGEFTARAFLAGRLTADQVDAVGALIHAADEAAARTAARAAHRSLDALRTAAVAELTDLLALVEGAIDFTDEEDIRPIAPADLATALRRLHVALGRAASSRQAVARAARPHVALVGWPNAGKSTLFNALLGFERAIVSPVVGTTRDVLSADVTVGGLPLVLQDCAGLGATADDLALAAHVAAEQTAATADLILWVHDHAAPWTPAETAALARLPADRVILVLSKCDRGQSAATPPPRADGVCVSATDAASLAALRQRIAARAPAPADHSPVGERLLRAARLLEQTAERIPPGAPDLPDAELVALELRDALAELGTTGGELVDDVLGRVFARFCVGK